MAEKGLKTTYEIGSTLVGEITAINGIEPTKGTTETTTIDKSWRTFRSGLKDGGEVSVEGYYKKGEVGQLALKTEFDLDDEPTPPTSHVITFPSGATWTFGGVVTAYKIGDANLDDNLAFSASIKISGEPVFLETV